MIDPGAWPTPPAPRKHTRREHQPPAHLVLVCYPSGMGYEKNGPQRLWDPRPARP